MWDTLIYFNHSVKWNVYFCNQATFLWTHYLPFWVSMLPPYRYGAVLGSASVCFLFLMNCLFFHEPPIKNKTKTKTGNMPSWSSERWSQNLSFWPIILQVSWPALHMSSNILFRWKRLTGGVNKSLFKSEQIKTLRQMSSERWAAKWNRRI